MVDKYWTTRTLEKLRIIVTKQSIADTVVKWQYDNGTPSEAENDALKILANSGIFDLSQLGNEVGPPFDINEFGVLTYNGDSLVAYHFADPMGDAVIAKFNPERYVMLCKKYGLDAYEETYAASLDLINEVPIVVVGNNRYTLPTLHAGKTTDIIRFAYQNASYLTRKKDLKEKIGITSLPNVKNALRSSLFDAKTGILRHFINVSPDSIMINAKATLTVSEFEEIKAKAIY